MLEDLLLTMIIFQQGYFKGMHMQLLTYLKFQKREITQIKLEKQADL
jgi:hypothetical protein